MDKSDMNTPFRKSDASFYYRSSSAIDTAVTDSSAVWGNLADAMRDATVLMPTTWVLEPVVDFPFQVKSPASPPNAKPPTEWHEPQSEEITIT